MWLNSQDKIGHRKQPVIFNEIQLLTQIHLNNSCLDILNIGCPLLYSLKYHLFLSWGPAATSLCLYVEKSDYAISLLSLQL